MQSPTRRTGLFGSIATRAALGAALMLPASGALAYTIVLKGGKTFEAQAAPEYKDGKAIFIMKGGSKGSVAEASVDKAATERANRPAPPASKESAKAGDKGTAKPLGQAAPGGNAKASFTNADLQKSEGSGGGDGSASSDSGAAPKSDVSEEEWAKKHDEEMARLEKERKGAAGGGDKAAPKGDADKGDADKGDADKGEKGDKGDKGEAAAKGGDKADAGGKEDPQKKVAELKAKLADLDKKIGGGAGDMTTVNERIQVAAELNEAEKEAAGQ